MMSNLVVHARIELEKTRRRLTDIFESLRLFEEWVILEDQRQSRSRLSSSFSDTARLRRSQMSRKSGSIIRLRFGAVSYTHLRAHETRHDLVCRLLLEKKKKPTG